MRESQVLFRRRAALYAAVSLALFLALLLGLRYSYQKINRTVIADYGASQKELAGRMAAQTTDEIDSIGRQVQRLAMAAEALCATSPAPCQKLFVNQIPVFRKDGALDILLLDSPGRTVAGSADQDFFSTRGMQGWPPEAVAARKRALVAASRGAVFSEIFTYRDPRNKERPVVLVAAPVFTRATAPAVAAPTPAATDTLRLVPEEERGHPAQTTAPEPAAPGSLEISGAVAVPLSLEPVSARIQKLGAARGRRRIMLLGPSRLILSHSNPDYIGAAAAEIMSLTEYPDLKQILDAMLSGKSGYADYIFPEGGPGKGRIHWWMAYAPAQTPAGDWGAAIMYPHADIPLNGIFFWKYAGVALAALILLAALNLLPLMEYRRVLATSDELLKMHDISAINEILRTINEELTEDKRVLETRVQEIETIHEQNLHMLDRVAQELLELFGSIRKPTREQRNSMRQLKHDVEMLQKKPEGRFWKKASED